MLLRFDIHLSDIRFEGESSVYLFFFFSLYSCQSSRDIGPYVTDVSSFHKKYDIELSATGDCNQRFSETFLTIVLYIVSFRVSTPA